MFRYKFDGMVLDEKSRELTGGQRRLSHIPLNILLYLVQNRGRAVTFEEIKLHCWPREQQNNLASIDIHPHLSKIRQALGEVVAGKRLVAPEKLRTMFRDEGVIVEPILTSTTTPAKPSLIHEKMLTESGGDLLSRDDLLTQATESKDGAAFRVLLLFDNSNRDSLVLERTASKAGTYSFTLKVDLTDQDIGIFSNAGKDWLDKKYDLKNVNDESGLVKRLLESSKSAHDFFMGRDADSAILRWRDITRGVTVPLRWASGGTLPIIQYEDDEWVALFFRDRKPVGLNLANGASEAAEEWLNPSYLSSRELAEEMSIQQGKMRPGGVLQYYLVDDYQGSPIDPRIHTPAEISAFMSSHNRLREEHDGITITSALRKREAHGIYTDFSIEVSDRQFRSTEWKNYLPSINPVECGIETIRLSKIKLQDGDWLVDGEIVPSPWDPYPYLLRRPVILLRLSTLRELLDSDGSFGEPIHDQDQPDFFDCKQLPSIPMDSVHLFIDFEDGDIDRRRRRQSRIERGWREAGCTEESLKTKKWDPVAFDRSGCTNDRFREIRAWHREWNQIESFMNQYGVLLQGLQKKATVIEGPWKANLPSGPFTTLCPVTWKSLELAFRWKYI